MLNSIKFFNISLSAINYVIAIQIFRELTIGSYKIQKMYGGLISYWISNFILYITLIYIITIQFILIIEILMKVSIENIWLHSFLHSLSIIPFYYILIILWNRTKYRLTLYKDILLLNLILGNVLASFIQILQRFQ